MDIVGAHLAMIVSFLRQHTNSKIIVTCGLSALIIRFLRLYYQKQRLSRNLHQKKQYLEKSVSSLRSALEVVKDTKDELLALTELDLCDLRKRIDDETVTPLQLVQAYQLKALSLYDKGNSGICEFVRDAYNEARELHSQKEMHPTDSRSPLYGIPVSIEESLMLRGYDSTGGLIKRCNKSASYNCEIVQDLRNEGAIPFVITASSQALSIDGSNNIFGDMVNPHNPKHITGGSSCGEAVLLAQRGSPVGIGSDMSGSIRIPAAFCGLASLKLTYRRLCPRGVVDLFSQSAVGFHQCPGFMSRKVDNLVAVTRTLLKSQQKSKDALIVPMPFDESLFGSKDETLSIGFYDTFIHPDVMHTVPAIRESVNQAVAALVKAGHRVSRFDPPDVDVAYRLFLSAILADGGCELRSLLAHEPLCAQMRMFSMTLCMPYWMRAAGDFFLSLIGCRPLAFLRTLGSLRSAKDVIDFNKALEVYREDFRNNALSLDAIICPVSAYPAPPCSASPSLILPSAFYAALYNLLDYPAGTVPTGFVDRVDVMEATKAAINQRLDGELFQSRVSVMQKDSEGLPVAVQVVGKPFREEVVLRVMHQIETALNQSTTNQT
ncbi:Fatty-acid amide hydrolase 1 [Fasciolopsis buskii]|uniref:Fatty-acid amide hydrolase 1 n=1 Tax=Fasciolopsis buskii TaxID=27845 RepID=A0A8E0S5U6_9TREM|nr:Fatty-acid amide hydrolase 1 [Fasciolopsis buski]